MYEDAERELSELQDTFDAKVAEETKVQKGAADDFEATIGAAGDELRAALVRWGWPTHPDALGEYGLRELADLLL